MFDLICLPVCVYMCLRFARVSHQLTYVYGYGVLSQQEKALNEQRLQESIEKLRLEGEAEIARQVSVVAQLQRQLDDVQCSKAEAEHQYDTMLVCVCVCVCVVLCVV